MCNINTYVTIDYKYGILFFLARSVSLSRRLIASLLANGFLCAFSALVEQNSGTNEGPGLNFDQFFSVFALENK